MIIQNKVIFFQFIGRGARLENLQRRRRIDEIGEMGTIGLAVLSCNKNEGFIIIGRYALYIYILNLKYIERGVI